MNIFRMIGMAAFAAGILFFIFGVRATHKVNEEVVEKITGHYTDTTTWYIVGGVVLIVIGVGLIARRSR